jgi:CBS domain-containing protein
MLARDVMTRDVVTTRPSASIEEAAGLLIQHRVSGLPVLDEAGRVAGLVTEADLIARQGPQSPTSWWHWFLSEPQQLAEEYLKAKGSTVGDVMTRAVICVDPRTPIGTIAAIFERHGIKRVPVVEGGRLIGIVSRVDLVRTLAERSGGAAPSATDAEIVQELTARLDREPWAEPAGVMVKSDGGVVALWGIVESERERAATVALARNVPGVKQVQNFLSVRSHVLPYVYGAAEEAREADLAPPELRKDPWDPQDPTARP